MLDKDDGYIIGGQMNSIFLFVKIDAGKTRKIYKTYEVLTPGGMNDCRPTSDGGYMLVGGGCQGGCGVAIKVDGNGELEWGDNFTESALSSYAGSGFRSVDTTLEGYCAIVGEQMGGGRGFVLTVSLSKEIISFKEYSDAYRIQSIKTTKNGEAFLAGATITQGNGGTDIYVIKTNANGTIIDHTSYGTSSDEEAASLQLTNNGGSIVVGNDWIIKTDENGNVD